MTAPALSLRASMSCPQAMVLTVALVTALCHFAFLAAIPDTMGADRSHPFLTNGQTFTLAQAFALKAWLYRPLSIFFEHNTAALYFHHGHRFHLAVVMVTAILNGAQAGLVFHLVHRVSASAMAALAATVLAVLSTASLAGSWFGMYALFELGPLLSITAGMAFYVEYRLSGKRRHLIGVAAAGLVGCWFREIGILLPSALLVLELLRLPKGPSLALPLGAALMAHGLYPSALPHALGWYPHEVLFLLAQDEIKANLAGNTINWVRAGRLINEVPPMLWLGTALAAALFVRDELAHGFRLRTWYDRICEAVSSGPDPRIPGWHPVATLFATLIGMILAGSLAVMIWSTPWPMSTSPTLKIEALPLLGVGLFMAVSALRFGALLPLWFLAGYPSLIRFPANHESQMPFVTVPLCILVALWWRELLCRTALAECGRAARTARAAGVGIAVLGLFTQVANLPYAFFANLALRNGIQAMADWTRRNLPAGSLVFVNSFMGFELWDRSGRSFDVRWLNRFGPIHHIPNFRKTFEFGEQVKEVAIARSANRQVYYLLLTSGNEEGPYLLPTGQYEQLARFDIDQHSVPFDPIRRLLARPAYGQFFGPTHWITTFDQTVDKPVGSWRTSWVVLRQTELNEGSSGRRTVSATAPRLPKMQSPGKLSELPPAMTAAPPQLLIDGHKGSNYNVVLWDDRFFAVHRMEGSYQPPVDYPGRATKMPVLVDETLEGVLAKVDAIILSSPVTPAAEPTQPPPAAIAIPTTRLVVDGHKATNYNILLYAGVYYGVHRGEGSYQPGTDYGHRRTTMPVFAAASLAEVQSKIDAASGGK